LPKRIKKRQGKGGETRGEGEGERQTSCNVTPPLLQCSADTSAVFVVVVPKNNTKENGEGGREKRGGEGKRLKS